MWGLVCVLMIHNPRTQGFFWYTEFAQILTHFSWFLARIIWIQHSIWIFSVEGMWCCVWPPVLWNHKVVWVGKDLKTHPVPTPSSWKDNNPVIHFKYYFSPQLCLLWQVLMIRLLWWSRFLSNPSLPCPTLPRSSDKVQPLAWQFLHQANNSK